MQLPLIGLRSDLDILKLNEAAVNAEINEKIISFLGYKTQTPHNVYREQDIIWRYPHLFLGHKNSKTDPILKGRPDYILEIREIGNWILEAKAGSEVVGMDDIDQAYTYASVPQIRAPMFAICNGMSFVVFETRRHPNADPILSIDYDQIEEKRYAIYNLLSPAGFARRYPRLLVETGRPLAPGFGPSARILKGRSMQNQVRCVVKIEGTEVLLPPQIIRQIEESYESAIGIFIGDRCGRLSDGTIFADVKMTHGDKSHDEFAKQFELEYYRYICRDEEVSLDPTVPSIFECTINRTIPPGTAISNPMTGQTNIVPIEVPISYYAEATGYVSGSKFIGEHTTRISHPINYCGKILSFEISVAGSIDFDFER